MSIEGLQGLGSNQWGDVTITFSSSPGAIPIQVSWGEANREHVNSDLFYVNVSSGTGYRETPSDESEFEVPCLTGHGHHARGVYVLRACFNTALLVEMWGGFKMNDHTVVAGTVIGSARLSHGDHALSRRAVPRWPSSIGSFEKTGAGPARQALTPTRGGPSQRMRGASHVAEVR